MPNWTKNIFYCLIAASFICVVILSFFNYYQSAAVLATASIAMLVITDADRLQSFTLWGLKAELIAQTSEADQAAKRANEAYVICVAATVHLLTRSGRFSSKDDRVEGHKLICDIEQKAKEINNDEISTSLAHYKNTIRQDHLRNIKTLAHRKNSDSQLASLTLTPPDETQPTPQELRALAQQTPTPEIYEQLISNYEIALGQDMPDLPPV